MVPFTLTEAALPFPFDSRWRVHGTAIRNQDSASRASVDIAPATWRCMNRETSE